MTIAVFFWIMFIICSLCIIDDRRTPYEERSPDFGALVMVTLVFFIGSIWFSL